MAKIIHIFYVNIVSLAYESCQMLTSCFPVMKSQYYLLCISTWVSHYLPSVEMYKMTSYSGNTLLPQKRRQYDYDHITKRHKIFIKNNKGIYHYGCYLLHSMFIHQMFIYQMFTRTPVPLSLASEGINYLIIKSK